MPFKLGLVVIALAFLAACSESPPEASPPDMTLETLLARHAEARGGAQAIEALKSTNVDVEITEPDFTVRGRYRATRDGYMRIDVYTDDTRVFTEALGPDGGWQMFDDGEIAELSENGAQALQRGIVSNLYGLHELPGLGYRLEFAGSTMRNGSAFWELTKTAPDGFSETLFLDKDTFLVASEIETAALHPDIDATKVRQETFHSDYEEIDGLVFAQTSEKKDLDTGKVIQTTAVTTREINPVLDESQFERPTPN